MNRHAALIEWLTPDGVDFFRNLIHDGVMDMSDAIHFREGRDVRNWMRGNTSATEDYIENHWHHFVIGALETQKETVMPSNVTEEMITEASEIAALLMQKAGVAYNSYGHVRDPAGRNTHADASATILAAMIMAGGNPTNG